MNFATTYHHDTDDGQVIFHLRFDVEPGSDGRTDGWATLPSVIDVEPVLAEPGPSYLRCSWFADEYEHNASFRESVDRCCLDAASETLVGSNER